MPNKNNQAGFTLIEVLISAVILFMFLALASQAFSQAAQSSLKAERAAKVSAAVPLLLETIKQDIMAARSPQGVKGSGVFLDLDYRWQAKLIQRKAPVRRFDPSEMEMKDYAERFNLWQVDLQVGLGSYQRNWQYEEISWYE